MAITDMNCGIKNEYIHDVAYLTCSDVTVIYPVFPRFCVRSIEGLEVERSKNICQERKRKGLDAKNATVGGIGWKMGRDWMQRTRVWWWWDGRWEGIRSKERVEW
jgi:hypothetical protein